MRLPGRRSLHLAEPMTRRGSIDPSGISPRTRDSIPGRSRTRPERSSVMACLQRKKNLRVSDLNRDEMQSALAELADRLNARNVKARIYLVGGAVMVLAFDARFTTGDIDGAMYPSDDVLVVAAEIGKRRGLGAEWLNNSASQFIPVFKDPDWKPILKSGNVEIVAAD